MIARQLILRSASFPFVEKTVRKSALFRPVVSRFIAGDALSEALEASNKLLESGYKVSLDLLGENTHSEAESLEAAEAYKQMLISIGDQGNAPAGYRSGAVEKLNISIKLTQCGLDQGDDFAEANFRKVLELASQYGNFVRVDMEGSEYTERTVSMLERVHPDFGNTGTVLQSYLYRTPQDLKRLNKLGCRLRLVKGAYLEPPELAYPNKEDVDKAYVELAKEMLAETNYPAFGTQDEKMIEAVVNEAKQQNYPKERFEFQMLYGIRRDLQESLKNEGYPVRVYVPYGNSWYPYFTRRLAERPANVLFILKALFKG